MVHRNRRLVRADRGEVPTAATAGGGRVVLIDGDLHRDDLGWSPDRAEALLAHDVVVHCAADTSLGASDGDRRALNVEGTRRLLQWLARGASPPALVHVSTAYVCGARSGSVAEAPASCDGFNNGYEASKAEAERLVSGSGLTTVIARPSIVVGRWADGALSRFDNVYGLIRLCGEGRLRELPAAPHATLDLVPIDHVVGGLVDLVERVDQAAGRIVHLASGSPVPVAALGALDVPGFHRPRLVPPATDRRAWRLPLALRRLPRAGSAFRGGDARGAERAALPPDRWRVSAPAGRGCLPRRLHAAGPGAASRGRRPHLTSG